MLELNNDSLTFSFPEIHEHCKLTINFIRTLRIPDDEKSYPLPPGLGNFPLRHVEDFADSVPADWNKHGGIMLPMYQSEAMWLSFSRNEYPFAVKISAGKICAVTGEEFSNDIHNDHEKKQDYLICPDQPWLDGFCVEKGKIRQFVAMPLGLGYTAEEQITGKAEHGGLQIVVYPMKKELYLEILRKKEEEEKERLRQLAKLGAQRKSRRSAAPMEALCSMSLEAEESEMCFGEMGLAAGGSMQQEIFSDSYGLDTWDTQTRGRCFVHLLNSMAWRSITGSDAPSIPFTAKEYDAHGLPWFDYYDDAHSAVEASDTLKNLKSVAQLSKEKQQQVLPENSSVKAEHVIPLKKNPNSVSDSGNW